MSCRSGGLEHSASAFFWTFFSRTRVGLVKKSDGKQRKKSIWTVSLINTKQKERTACLFGEGGFRDLPHFQICKKKIEIDKNMSEQIKQGAQSKTLLRCSPGLQTLTITTSWYASTSTFIFMHHLCMCVILWPHIDRFRSMESIVHVAFAHISEIIQSH